MPVATLAGDHVLDCDQVDLEVEFVISRGNFVRLVDFSFEDVASETGFKDLDLGGHLQRNVGYLLLRR